MQQASGMGAPVALTRSRIARCCGIVSANGLPGAFVIAESVNQTGSRQSTFD